MVLGGRRPAAQETMEKDCRSKDWNLIYGWLYILVPKGGPTEYVDYVTLAWILHSSKVLVIY